MHDKVTSSINGLKDFQKKTADYVFERMYIHGQDKMLIADEVGLGKTIIARGIIAKAFQRFLDNPGKRKQFRVVYICSNLALATQNITKLNFFGDETMIETNVNRLTYLALKPGNKENTDFRISALTPGTSFDNRNKFGEANERAIIYALLVNYAPFRNNSRRNGLRWMLKGNKGNNWDSVINYYFDNRFELFHNDVFALYRQKLNDYHLTRDKEPSLFEYFGRQESISLWHGLMRICDDLDGRNIHKFENAGELVSTLRRLLAQVCVPYLDADIFVLDEFQRYNQLIQWEQEEQAPAVEMAKAVFSLKDAKILMLSATPFKAYTNDFDENNGEVHHSELTSVLQFLMQGETKDFWKSYEENRKTFSKIIADSDNWISNNEKIKLVKQRLEDIYTSAMVRTERLLVSHDGNAMIQDVLKDQTLELSAEDIIDFINLDAVSQKLNSITATKLPVPIEYVKSTPYALSFLEGYQLKKRLINKIDGDNGLKSLIRQNKDLFISKKDIENYNGIISKKASKLPNAKVRKLLEIDNDGWKLLWVPPTLPYYNSQGVFKDVKQFSKTLIFSSWVMVPKMIATVLSYEAERKSIGKLPSDNKVEIGERINYFDRSRSPKPRFTFKSLKGEEPKQLSNFSIVYPCVTLASLYDPQKNVSDNKSLRELRKLLFTEIKTLLDTIDIKQFGTGSGESSKWYWAAPVLIDKLTPSSSAIITEWFSMQSNTENVSIHTEGNEEDKSEHTGRTAHFNTLKELFNNPIPSLPVLTEDKYEDLINHLVEITLAGPATCLYRSYSKYFEQKELNAKAAYCTALSFLTLFNKPEAIAVIRLSMNKNAYWRQVLEYCIDGNFQSMIDEFIYLLYDCENLKSVVKLQEYITDILTLKTSTLDIDNQNSFLEKGKKLSIRTHYAMDFGMQKIVTTHGSNRQVNLRQTFNSPFRPFVLATTSIGQEGLDFHLYCKRIVHWNLPSNPIDFEQREGRINRYKCLVIRQNVAEAYRNQLLESQEDVTLWDQLFELAKVEKKNARIPCDLIPFWHVEPEGGFHSKIERYVPLYPFSKDLEKFKYIQQVLTYYRLTFGQPRQDDLIKTFKKDLNSKDFKDLMINLSPMVFDKLK